MPERQPQTSPVHQVVNVLFSLCCMCGLIWQLVLVSELYFEYKVSTRIQISIPEKIEAVGTSFCTRFTDIIDYPRLNSETGKDYAYNPWDGGEIQHLQDILTVKEIFDFTPGENDSIKTLYYRKNNSYERKSVPAPDVYEFIEIKKYVYLEHMCYRFGIRNASTMSYGYYAVTPVAAGMIYEIVLSDSFKRSDLIKIAMHDQEKLPYRSLKIQPVMWRQYSEPKDGSAPGSAKYNMYKSYQTMLTSYLMPAPYETMCYDYKEIGFVSDAHCVQDCVYHKAMQQFELVPFSVLIVWPNITMSMISAHDIKNFTVTEKLLKIEETCSQSLCKRKQCEYATSMTSTEAFVADDFSLKMTVPSQPWTNVTSSPSLNLVEFLTYVMSTISTWTGMSVMSFMPTHLIKLITSRRVQRVVRARCGNRLRACIRQEEDTRPRARTMSDRFLLQDRPATHRVS